LSREEEQSSFLDRAILTKIPELVEGKMQTVRPEDVGLISARLERIGSVMQGYIDRKQFAGMITLVARHGKVAHLGTFGWQNVDAGKTMAEDTLFAIYSMSKPITSTAAMLLVEEGKLRLSDPLWRYVPAFKDVKVMQARNGIDYDLVPPKRDILVHDLFTHTAGLSYGFDEQSALDRLYVENWIKFDRNPDLTLDEAVNAFAKLPLAYHPGTAYRYSVAIDVLGYLVQLVSGQPFDEFLQERIFAPLGMPDTGFWVPPEKASRLATIYGPGKKGGIVPVEARDRKTHLIKPSWCSGGGGLISTVGDYARFGQMLLNGGELDGVRLLGRKTVEWMLQDHLPLGVRHDDPCLGFGLGGCVLLRPGLSHRPGSVGKFGWGGAANTEWWIDPREDLQCLLMLQYVPAFTIPIVEDFAQLAYAALV
jgi:CubicO group peptidase (beta-lactamase class C family)